MPRISAVDDVARLQADLIPSLSPGGTAGAQYSWEDRGADLGQIHYYHLVSVDQAGAEERVGEARAGFQARMR